MKSLENCRFTHENNVFGTLNILFAMKELVPDCHLIKLGSMGEYGTPNGIIKEENCAKQPGSWYHATKVHDSTNIEFTCRNWGFKSTDIMQGVLYGLNYWDRELTRFDIDECFGTVINRFCAQAAAKIPLVIFGKGTHKRSFLALKDSIECIRLLIDNPPKNGEYRVVNQFDEIYSILDLANIVFKITGVEFVNIQNPRNEIEDHPYSIKRNVLNSLGFNPKTELETEVVETIKILKDYIGKIKAMSFTPLIKWE
jgi:UDP-sulfoquinovose synthase